jgi:hypothetical protein
MKNPACAAVKRDTLLGDTAAAHGEDRRRVPEFHPGGLEGMDNRW